MSGNVIVSPNIKRTSERIDFNGNVIDPKTKQILVPAEVESVLPPPNPTLPKTVIAPVASPIAKDDGLSVLAQIQATKQRLQELEELKKLQIQQKKAEIELLQQ